MTAAGYAAPRTLEEALRLLASSSDARVLAGGHGLLLEPNRSRLAGALLVDLRKIPGLAGIERQGDGGLTIGAMATLASVAASPEIRQMYPALSDAARLTGDAQFRNRATVGGMLASLDPHADLLALILAIDATINVAGGSGPRTVSADALLTGSAQALRAGDVITGLTVAAPPARSAVAYEAQRHPATLGAICGVAASVALATDGTVTACRAALTGATARPARLTAVESALVNKRPADGTVSAAAGAAGEGSAFRDDLFASADYRRHLARVLTARAVQRAVDRAAASTSYRTGKPVD